MELSTPIDQIRGVGPKSANSFQKAAIYTIGDLIYFLPRTYEDYSKIDDIKDVKPGKVTIRAVCDKISTRPIRRGFKITTATLSDGTGKLQAVWFNQPYRVKQLSLGDEFFFSGIFEYSYNRYQLSNPSAEKVSDVPVQTDRILPIYRSIAGLKTALVRKVLNEIRPIITMLPESLPTEIVSTNKLVSNADALLAIHFPENIDDVAKAKNRLAFEEIFQLLLASQLNKQANSKLKSWQIPFSKKIITDFVKALPFQLTDSQRLAAWDILQDVEKPAPMNRMLQGDVGSGKTVVAGLVACLVAKQGYQTAVMAPTEILAKQHAETLHKLLDSFGIKVVLLTGSVKAKSRMQLLKSIETGEVDVVVGTHALIQPTVAYHKLGLVVVDEQHRFGVEQRQALSKKSKKMPHLLAMTATPIPRSLALTLYGELDISVLTQKPKNRKDIISKVWSPNSRNQLYQLVDKEIGHGRQVYVVCSVIDDNPVSELKSVQTEYNRLKSSIFKSRRIGMLHGKMAASEKAEIMQNFQKGLLDILVSTTVIEVGVDVPNASVMIIENADRFGLAQLHQLRGRVGRSDLQSYCYLIPTDSTSPTKRLREIEKSNDGFYLAEVDLELRGPGEIYGRTQHGQLNLQIATLADTRLIASAQKSAAWFVQSKQNLLSYKQLASKVQEYQRLTTLN